VHGQAPRADDYDGLRREQAELRKKGVCRGIGLSSFIEVTNPSPMFYGVGGARIAAQDGCTIKLDANGAIVAATGVTEQGQGTEPSWRRSRDRARRRDELRESADRRHRQGALRRRHLGSRAAGIGGEAVLQAGSP